MVGYALQVSTFSIHFYSQRPWHCIINQLVVTIIPSYFTLHVCSSLVPVHVSLSIYLVSKMLYPWAQSTKAEVSQFHTIVSGCSLDIVQFF
jgi:hypothetical protein